MTSSESGSKSIGERMNEIELEVYGNGKESLKTMIAVLTIKVDSIISNSKRTREEFDSKSKNSVALIAAVVSGVMGILTCIIVFILGR